MSTLFRMHGIIIGVLCASMLFSSALVPRPAHAQELQILDAGERTLDPEIYRAYYGRLEGDPQTFTITATEPFQLSLAILMPYSERAKADISAAVIDTSHPTTPLAILDGSSIEWVNFFNHADRGEYLAGPSFKAGVAAGTYEIKVWSSNNDSPFVLVVGTKKPFSLGEIIGRYRTLPEIKRIFFGESGASALMTPLLVWPLFGAASFLVLVVAGMRVRNRRQQAILVNQ